MSESMPISHALSEEQYEVLKETANIGMGRAGDSLAKVLKTFVELSLPTVLLIDAQELPSTITRLIGNNVEVSAVRQAFFHHWRGEAIVIYGQNGCKDLTDLMGYPKDIESHHEIELLLDVGNILIGATLNGLAEQLNVEICYSPPSVLADKVLIENLLKTADLNWRFTLLLEVNFGLENRAFKSHLITMLSEDTITALKRDLDLFLESL